MTDVGGFAGSCFTNLSEDLGVGRISAKFIPCHLTVDLKKSSAKIRTDPVQQPESDKRFMKRINTSD
jgi:hypothetical protein